MKPQKAIDFITAKMKADLPPYLVYHSLDHTLEVIENAEAIADHEGITGKDRELVRTAAAYHDSGLLEIYENHEEVSARLARETLPNFDFAEDDIKTINGMIAATKLPQSPHNILEEIICDADLSYLGGPHYDRISHKLLKELEQVGYDLSGDRWLKLQINFLKNHRYWTRFSKEYLKEGKEEVLERLEQQLKKKVS